MHKIWLCFDNNIFIMATIKIEKGIWNLIVLLNSKDVLNTCRLSWADIMFYHFAAELPDKEVIKGYAKLNALFNKVANLPKIKSWVERRPDSAV